MIKITKPALILCACLMMTGCWESSNVTFHQPGMYFGSVDMLKTDSALLQKRFARQMDR